MNEARRGGLDDRRDGRPAQRAVRKVIVVE